MTTVRGDRELLSWLRKHHFDQKQGLWGTPVCRARDLPPCPQPVAPPAKGFQSCDSRSPAGWWFQVLSTIFPGALSSPGHKLRVGDRRRVRPSNASPFRVHRAGSGPAPSPPAATPASPGEQAQVTQAGAHVTTECRCRNPAKLQPVEISHLWQPLTSLADGGF